MADFTALKTAIQNAIKQNGNEEITGNLLQDVLLAIVTTLGDGSINDLITALDSEATTRSQADGTLQQNINAEAQARQLADSTLQGGINTVSAAITAINNAIGNGCVYAGIATPSSTPASGKVFYLALTAGTYTNYGGLEVPQGINILKNNGSTWSLDSFLGIDDAPTPSSNNLVKSGGVYASIASVLSKIAEGYLYVGIATAATNPSTSTTKVFYIATAAGTYTNFLDSSSQPLVLTQGINILKYNGTSWSVEQVWGVDDDPTIGSNNLVKSSGVYPFTKSLLLSEYDFVSTENGNVWLEFPLLKGYTYKFKIQDDSVGNVAIFGEKKNNVSTGDYTIAYTPSAGTIIEAIPSDNYNYIRIYSSSAGVKVKITSQCANITEHNRISDIENELPIIKVAVDSPLSNLVALETTNYVVNKSGFVTASGFGSLKYDISGCTGVLYKSPLNNINFMQCCITDTELKILWLSEHIADGEIDYIDLRNIANAKYLFLSVKLDNVSCWVRTLKSGNPLILSNRIEELSFEKIHYNTPLYEKDLFLNSNGTTSSAAGNFTTDFISIDYEKFVSISANALFGNPYGGGIAFYDSEQNFIRSICSLNNDYSQDTLYSFTKEELSENYNINHFAYIRVCGKTGSTYLNCILLSNITSQINKNKNDIISINDCLSITKQSLSGSTLMTETDVFINSDGSASAVNNFVSSDFIHFNGVAYNIKITSHFYNSYGGGIVFYDKDKQFISSICGIDTGSIPTTHIFGKNEIPRNAAFIRTSCKNTEVSIAFIEIRTCNITPNLENDDIREKVFIKNTDTQEDIVDKMFYAYNKKNCNVYFERGVYTFTTAFDYIHDNYNGQNHNELPIGGNNKYFFNGSTLIGTSVTEDEEVYGNESLLGSQRKSGSYELYDAILIANDLTYVVHDEGGGVFQTEPYVRKYSNIKMRYHKIDKTSDIMKCIGGGTALYGNVIIENCLFECDNGIDVSYHGFVGNANGEFMLTISNCYFSVGLGLHNLAENQVATAQVSSCSFAQAVIDSQGRWTKYLFCNEIRE